MDTGNPGAGLSVVIVANMEGSDKGKDLVFSINNKAFKRMMLCTVRISYCQDALVCPGITPSLKL